MDARFAWIRTFAGAGVAAAAILALGASAGCDRIDTPISENAAPDLSQLPEEFVTTISSSKPTVVDFYATWCGPCQEQKPHFAEVQRQYGEIATFLTVDVDEVPAMWEAYELEGIPTIIVFKNGKPIEKLVGMHTSDQIAAVVVQYAK